VGIERGGLQLQTETKFKMGRELIVRGEGRSEKRPGEQGPQNHLVQLPCVVSLLQLLLGLGKRKGQ